MLKYHPYKSDKPGKNTILSQKAIKKYILVRLEHLILLFTKMNNGNNDILMTQEK